MKHLLVAIDFSPVTERLLTEAERLAIAIGATVRVIHVAAPNPEFVGYEAGPKSVRDQRAKELRNEHRQLEEIEERLRSAGIDATTRLVPGATVATILEQATEIGADLVLLGARGVGAVRRALLGSTSEGIVRRSPCPVLIVPNHLAEQSSPD